MPRMAGRSPNIKAWDVERLINDLALGRPYSELVDEYGLVEQSLHAFKMRHKADVEAKKRDQSSEYSHIWSTRKGNRLRVLTCRLEEVEAQIELLHEHARREWKTISGVDPEASLVPLNSREYLAYVKEQRALLREIADQTGQLPQRVMADVTVAKSPLTAFDTLVMTEDGQLHGVVNP